MHRFVGLKTVTGSNVNLPGGLKDVYNPRTCLLCNKVFLRTPISGEPVWPQAYSTKAKPERVFYRVYKKRKDAKVVFKLPATPSNAKRKMRLTVLDSSIRDDVIGPDAFTSSHPSSSTLVGPKLAGAGITIILPPNFSRKPHNFNNHPGMSSVTPAHKNQAADLAHVEELIISGLCRNRYFVQSLSSPSSRDQQLNVLSPEPKPVDSPIPCVVQKKLITYKGQEVLKVKQENKTVVPSVTTAWEQGKTSDIPLVTPSMEQGITSDVPSVTSAEEQAKISDVKSMIKLRKRQSKKLENINEIIRKSAFSTKALERRVALIDVYVQSGRMKLALRLAEKGLQSLTGVPGSNEILEPIVCHAFRTADQKCLLSILSISKSHKAPLSVDTYRFCFGVLGQLKNPTKGLLAISRTLYTNMQDDGVTVDDVIQPCHSRPVKISSILKGLKLVDPELEAVHTPAPYASLYEVPLMSPLNSVSESKAPRFLSPAKGLLSEKQVQALVDQQIAAHHAPSYLMKNIVCSLTESEKEKLLASQKKVEDNWRETITAGLKASQTTSSHARGILPAVLDFVPIETFVDIVIAELHDRIEDSNKQSIGLAYAQRLLGKKVKEVYTMKVLEKLGLTARARKAHKEYCKQYISPELYPDGPSNPREVWDRVCHDLNWDDSNTSFLMKDWNSSICSQIGTFLYDILLKDAKIDENITQDNAPPLMVPTLYIVYRKSMKGYSKQLKMHPAVYHIFPTSQQPFIRMHPHELPMVCPPRPWISASDGVYPLSAPCLQRAPPFFSGEEAMMENILQVPTRDLHPCLDSLNQLSSVPWKINSPILDIVIEVFQSGGMKELAVPSSPLGAESAPKVPANASPSEKAEIMKQRADFRQENAAMYSQWCDTLYKLCIAHEFRDRIFWLPHNMDFRGRVYPISPHLQHMGNDMSRSLLLFARGEKLGPDGLNWLKLHTINLVGDMSKESLAARLAYADEIMPKILDSAEEPLTGEKWWMKSEYPWQTLAACMEIRNAIVSGDPENFVSCFPVHQDGSCNGLQHYAALGRDTLGAQSVNLVDTESPSDVYLCVANIVEQRRAEDAAKGNLLAQALEGFVSRKLVKAPVMTTVYGVTRYGADLQIRGTLKDMNFCKEEIRPAAAYLTKLVFQSLGEMFTSSRNIQEWLTHCADGISKGMGMPVRWVTPLGLPVLQPYYKERLPSKTKCLKWTGEEDWIDPSLRRVPLTMKQRNAFSPNFVHSLDSCHMMLTGLYCEQLDIPFVAVHDCYWVHAKNVDAMSKVCREQFVALHSNPILEDLSLYLMKIYEDYSADAGNIDAVEFRRVQRLFQAVPPKGDFDLGEVLKSKYFFS